MPLTLSEDQARLLRLRGQQFAHARGRRTGGAAGVVREVCGIQAQDPAAAALGIRARRAGLTAGDVERALAEERSIVRTWCMRGTLHFVASDDLGWLLGLLGPIFSRATQGRRAQLGLDDATSARALRALRSVLADSEPRTRGEIVESLAGRGIRLTGQARPHLLGLAALQGLVCQGPPRGREPTYVLLADWVRTAPPKPREEALAELARRYLAAYAPAAPEDFAAWSGLSLQDARLGWQAVAGGLVEVQVGRLTAWAPRRQASRLRKPAAQRPIVRLLPAYDTLLLGYRSRDLILPPVHAKRIVPGGGLVRPSVLLGGRIVGTWKIRRRGKVIEVIVEPFDRLPSRVWQELEAEADDIGHFLGGEAKLRLIDHET